MQPLFRRLLRYLRVVGMDPTLQNRTSKVLSFFAVTSVVFTLLPYVMEIVWYFEGFESLKRFDLIALPLWGFFSAFTFMLKRQEILKLISLRAQFLPGKMFKGETQTKIFAVNRITVRIFKFTIATFAMSPMVVLAVNLYSGDGQIFFLGYQKCSALLCYRIQFAFQIFAIYFVYQPIMGVFAIFFGSVILEAYCSLEFLACGYRNLTNSSEALKKNLKTIVDQHIRILRFTETIDKIYKNVLMIHSFMYTGVVIFCLNVIITSGTSLSTIFLVKYAIIPIVCSLESLVYFAGGTIISEKYELINRVVSEIDWMDVGEKRVRFGKDIAFVLMLTQHPPTLTVGSVMPLNLNTFVQILRVCYSVVTLIAAFQK